MIAGKFHGGDAATADLAVADHRTSVVSNLLKLITTSPNPFILLGDPGSGKTVTMLQAALSSIEQQSKRALPSAVVFVRLSEFEGSEDRFYPEKWHVLQFLKYKATGLSIYLDDLYSQGRLIVFFDGLDEMSRREYVEKTAALSKFAEKRSGKSLFSCRITDFSPAFIHQRLVLLPFRNTNTPVPHTLL